MGIKEALAAGPGDIAAEKEMIWLWRKTSGEMFLTNRVCIDLIGDFPTGILLSRLVDCLMSGPKHNCHILELRGRRWIGRTRSEWWEECRMTPRQFDRAVGILEKNGFIKTETMKRHGSPVKHISINWDTLLDQFRSAAKRLNSGGLEKWK